MKCLEEGGGVSLAKTEISDGVLYIHIYIVFVAQLGDLRPEASCNHASLCACLSFACRNPT
jgi:hypothetical protein